MTAFDKSRKMDAAVRQIVEAVETFKAIPQGAEQLGFLLALSAVIDQGNALAAKYYAETYPAGTLELSPAIVDQLNGAEMVGGGR